MPLRCAPLHDHKAAVAARCTHCVPSSIQKVCVHCSYGAVARAISSVKICHWWSNPGTVSQFPDVARNAHTAAHQPSHGMEAHNGCVCLCSGISAPTLPAAAVASTPLTPKDDEMTKCPKYENGPSLAGCANSLYTGTLATCPCATHCSLQACLGLPMACWEDVDCPLH